MTDTRPPLDMNALLAKAQEARQAELTAQTDRTESYIGKVMLEVTEIDTSLSGDDREQFAAAAAALFALAKASGDPAAFMAQVVTSSNGATQAQSAPNRLDPNSVIHDLRGVVELLDSNRADPNRHFEVGGVLAIIKAIVDQTFGPEAEQVGAPKEMQLFYDDKRRVQTLGALYVLREQNDALYEIFNTLGPLLPKLMTMVNVRVEHPTATDSDGKIYVFSSQERQGAQAKLTELQRRIDNLPDQPMVSQARALGSTTVPNGAGNGNTGGPGDNN